MSTRSRSAPWFYAGRDRRAEEAERLRKPPEVVRIRYPWGELIIDPSMPVGRTFVLPLDYWDSAIAHAKRAAAISDHCAWLQSDPAPAAK
jgi:hypothetical protein